MHEIFISYSSKHRELTRELAAVLEAQYGEGSVWWDKELEARGPYNEQIEAALNNARVAVVIWTTDAAVSRWVYAEAARASQQSKLVSVRPSDVRAGEIPMPFNVHQFAQMDDRARVLAAIDGAWRGKPIPTSIPQYLLYEQQHDRPLINPKLEPLPPNAGPVMLLQAKYAVVPYADVTGTAAELAAWCTDDPRPTTGRLIHGPGGLGKTRLMIDVAMQLRGRGWMAGFLDRPDELDDPTRRQRSQALDQLIDNGDDAGLLLVLDYAEGRQGELVDLGRRLAKRPGSAARPVRLILLARSAGEWWERLVTEQPELDGLLASTVDASAIVPLSVIPQPDQRIALFDAAVAAFGERGCPRPSVDPPPELRARIAAGEDFERPLAVQMAALLWLASAEPPAGSASIDKLLDRILGLERAHWVKLLGALSEDQARDLARGIGQVTLVQGVESTGTAERLLMGDAFYGDTPRARVAIDPIVRALRRLYGRAEGIGAIEPDLVGEHHVVGEQIGDAELVIACVAWIDRQPKDFRARHRRDLLTVLQRATSQDHGAKAVRRAELMLDVIIVGQSATFAAELVGVVIGTAGSLAHRLHLRLDDLGESALTVLHSYLPLQSLALTDISLHIACRMAQMARVSVKEIDKPSVTLDVSELARSNLASRLSELAIRLSHARRFDDALSPSQEAVQLYEELIKTDRVKYLPALATSLSNLGVDFSNTEKWPEALDAAQQAINIRRQLAATQPCKYGPELAVSLSNLGKTLSNLDRPQEALTVLREAVATHQKLREIGCNISLPDLAMSQNNLGYCLARLGYGDEALEVSREAVRIYRQVALTWPDAFLPELANSLSNVGETLLQLGRAEDALMAGEQAVHLCRQLASKRPDVFRSALARSLGFLSAQLSALGQQEKALAASSEAAQSYQQLVTTGSDRYVPELVRALTHVSRDLSNLGRREEAVDTSGRAAELARQLHSAIRPDAHLADLQTSLGGFGRDLSKLGRWTDAVAVFREAVHICRYLVAKQLAVFEPALALHLSNLAQCLSNIGTSDEEIASSREAVRIGRRLAQAQPKAFLPVLAESLKILGVGLFAHGRREEGLAVTEEAVAIYRQLAAAQPNAFLPGLAASLNNLALWLSDLQQALKVIEESVEIYRELVRVRPRSYLHELPGSLGAMACILADQNRLADATQTAAEGLMIAMQLFASYPRTFAPLVRQLLADVIGYSAAAGLDPDRALIESVTIALDSRSPDM